jgi:hypothetical protein
LPAGIGVAALRSEKRKLIGVLACE